MARKGNHHKKGLNRNETDHKFTVSESAAVSYEPVHTAIVDEENALHNAEPIDLNHQLASASPLEQKNKTKHSRAAKNKKFISFDKVEPNVQVQFMPASRNSVDTAGNHLKSDFSNSRGDDQAVHDGCQDAEFSKSSLDHSQHGLDVVDKLKHVGYLGKAVCEKLGASAFLIMEAGRAWFARQKPLLESLAMSLIDSHNFIRLKIELVYPIVWTWLLHLGKISLLLSVLWLDCSLRGLDSLCRLGTTSLLTVIWCTILSLIAMIGKTKFLIMLVTSALVAVLVGFTFAVFVIAISAIIFLWMFGSFWTTGFVIFAGGVAFSLGRERFALLITTLYSIYCSRSYVGWLGLALGMNLSFISSDVLIHFLKNNFNEHRANSDPEQSGDFQGRPRHFYRESMHVEDNAFRTERSVDRDPGEPSTSSVEAELNSEDEVMRLLNCTDHYAALGLSRYEDVDDASLKKEYRKKAMLVHPDKNMGNDKAAEAFKKLQNAYEVLLDSLKRKAYDDELRREELLNVFRRFQTVYQKNGRHGPVAFGFSHSNADEETHGESRRIACKKCGDFHVWFLTNRSKPQARWCQECKEFHQAKDGDGWVEQSFQPFLFGLLHKVSTPCAYVCAESRIYNATEWFTCQGMRCAANSHKPTFHVNTSIASKHGSAKGAASAQRSGGIPAANRNESMTQEEFFEWLQNAVQSGLFEDRNAPNDPSPKAGSAKSFGSSGSKKKRKGKKQW